MAIYLKRIYEPATARDGYRVLVDRLWPRGISKAQAAIAVWLRDVAPSAALRTWFNHDPTRWTEFRTRYRAELRKKQKVLGPLLARAKKGPLTLLYAARNERYNHAVALKALLGTRLRSTRSSRT
jgi:uncharacterized protein YeaO (DUF488 family)